MRIMWIMRQWASRTRKAIAVHTLFLIIMMALFAVVAFVLFADWTGDTGKQANKTACLFKRTKYCTDWRTNDYGPAPWDWYEKSPKGCELLDPPILKPKDKYECETVLGIK